MDNVRRIYVLTNWLELKKVKVSAVSAADTLPALSMPPHGLSKRVHRPVCGRNLQAKD